MDYIVDTIEDSLPINPKINSLELFPMKNIRAHQQKYKSLHIGLVQIVVKPLHRLGLYSPLFMLLREARFTIYSDSILAMFTSNLAIGVVYFDY